MILAAGRGERMRPLSDTTPKPLLKVHGKPLIEWHIEKLARAGFEKVVINVAHLGEQIIQTLGDGERFGIPLFYSDERSNGALESAGGIKKALPLLGDEPFLVVNGDIFCNYPFNPNLKLNNQLAHLILVPNPPHNPQGDFGLNGTLVTNNSSTMWTFSGIGYYNPKLFDTTQIYKAPLAPLLRQAIEQQRVSGEFYDGPWSDIGTPQRLQQINEKTISHTFSS